MKCERVCVRARKRAFEDRSYRYKNVILLYIYKYFIHKGMALRINNAKKISCLRSARV